MSKIYAFLGGRKMTIFLLCFTTLLVVFLFGYEVEKLANALYPYVLALVMGNVGVHFAKAMNKKDEAEDTQL